jgi:histone acetyltransferase MYST1
VDLPGSGDAVEQDAAPTTEVAAESSKEVVKIATTAMAETTKVGQHVVATIPAQELDEHEGLDEASLREHEEVTKVKNVALLELGQYQMETWYFSPLPKELLSERGFVEILYVCEFSFKMFARKSELLRFQARELPKDKRHPPGNEIYRNGKISSKSIE